MFNLLGGTRSPLAHHQNALQTLRNFRKHLYCTAKFGLATTDTLLAFYAGGRLFYFSGPEKIIVCDVAPVCIVRLVLTRVAGIIGLTD